MWRQRWWFFLNLSHDVLSALLQSFVWCETLKHLRYFLVLSRSPIFGWQSILDTHGKKQQDVFLCNKKNMNRHQYRSCWLYWTVVAVSYGKVAFSVGFFLASGSEGWTCYSQETKLAKFSPFFSRCISFAKSPLSFGSSLDKRVDMNNGACEASWTAHPLSSISLTNTSITCKPKPTINQRVSTFVPEILSSAGD